MSGLDRIRVPENRRWIASVITGVLTVMGLMVSSSWWAGAGWGRFAISFAVSLAISYAIAVIATRRKLR